MDGQAAAGVDRQVGLIAGDRLVKAAGLAGIGGAAQQRALGALGLGHRHVGAKGQLAGVADQVETVQGGDAAPLLVVDHAQQELAGAQVLVEPQTGDLQPDQGHGHGGRQPGPAGRPLLAAGRQPAVDGHPRQPGAQADQPREGVAGGVGPPGGDQQPGGDGGVDQPAQRPFQKQVTDAQPGQVEQGDQQRVPAAAAAPGVHDGLGVPPGRRGGLGGQDEGLCGRRN